MFAIAVLAVFAFAALLLGLALVAGILHLAFRVVLFPVFLGVGLVKLVLVPIVGLIAVVVLLAVAPVVLGILAVLAIPALALAALGALVWGGLRLVV